MAAIRTSTSSRTVLSAFMIAFIIAPRLRVTTTSRQKPDTLQLAVISTWAPPSADVGLGHEAPRFWRLEYPVDTLMVPRAERCGIARRESNRGRVSSRWDSLRSAVLCSLRRTRQPQDPGAIPSTPAAEGKRETIEPSLARADLPLDRRRRLCLTGMIFDIRCSCVTEARRHVHTGLIARVPRPTEPAIFRVQWTQLRRP
jgi:hypothetical protein